MSRIAAIGVVLIGALVIAAGAPAASAAPATLKGTVVGSALPDSGVGVASVRAVEAQTGIVGGADFTAGNRDRWRLRVSPGAYALGATAVPFEGAKPVDRLVAFARVRSGKTTKLKLKLKRKRTRHHASAAGVRVPARVAEGFGDVDVDYPAIWVKEWDVQSQNPDLGVLRKGIPNMLITDLVAGFGATPGCDAVIVERARIDEVINEQRLQQLPGFDPGTAVRQGRLIRDNASVTGTLTEAGGQITMSATYVDRRTGRTRTVSVQGPGEALFALEEQLAAKLVEVICHDTVNRIEGTFDLEIDTGSIFRYGGNVSFYSGHARDLRRGNRQLQRQLGRVHADCIGARRDRRHGLPAERQQAVHDPDGKRQHRRLLERADLPRALRVQLQHRRGRTERHDGHHAAQLPAGRGGLRGARVGRLPGRGA